MARFLILATVIKIENWRQVLKCLIVATLLVFVNLSSQAQSSVVGLPFSCKVGNLSEQSPDTIRAMSAFLTELKDAVEKNEKRRISEMADYPMSVSTTKGKLVVHSASEFVTNYAKLFTPEIRTLLLRQQPECISRVGAQGFTISRGEIWFDIFPDNKIKIIGIVPVVLLDEK
jgi:hypothetical protein